jgi:hypothetical protein
MKYQIGDRVVITRRESGWDKQIIPYETYGTIDSTVDYDGTYLVKLSYGVSYYFDPNDMQKIDTKDIPMITREAIKATVERFGAEYVTGLVQSVMEEMQVRTVTVENKPVYVPDGVYTYLRAIWNNGESVYGKDGENLLGKIAGIKTFCNVYTNANLREAKIAMEHLFAK